MIEQILDYINQLTPLWLYVALFAFSYIENIFPPSPSDLVVVVGGSLIATGSIHFIPTLIFTTIGSVLGFLTLYIIGAQFDSRIIKTGRIKFISLEGIEKVEDWFSRYGYWVILINRFLPGTRSVISFFAGLSRLEKEKTLILCAISAFAWNAIIIYMGLVFGKNIQLVDYYLTTYSKIVIAITIAVIIIWIIYLFLKKKRKVKNVE